MMRGKLVNARYPCFLRSAKRMQRSISTQWNSQRNHRSTRLKIWKLYWQH